MGQLYERLGVGGVSVNELNGLVHDQAALNSLGVFES